VNKKEKFAIAMGISLALFSLGLKLMGPAEEQLAVEDSSYWGIPESARQEVYLDFPVVACGPVEIQIRQGGEVVASVIIQGENEEP